ncbi:MAG: class I SAM-dependent methyltransferase [Solirubrobacterales bacterium]
MPAAPGTSAERIREINTAYHDVAAETYDSKWGIDFGATGQAQVRAKLRKALGALPREPFAEALEIGAGTGYFTLNLLQLGVIGRATATDISPGMLASLEANASGLGLEVSTEVTDAERLPFADGSFDLVFGHAVLHHIPDLERAFSELHRVLRPGGAIAFCGEPSRHGDRLAALPKRTGQLLAPAWRAAVGADPAPAAGPAGDNGHALESEVDVHAFSPPQLRTELAEAGFEAIRLRGEELLANVWGWGLRSVEASADPDSVPVAWRRFAFRSYLALQRLDESLLEPRLPPQLFYNLVLSARKAP